MSSMSNSLFDRIHDQSRAGRPPLEPPRSTTASTKPLNFNKAMEDFRTMFPHVDPDVIETVLRANDGVVQVTIDQLLVLSEGITSAEKENKSWDGGNQPRLPGYSELMTTTNAEEPPPAYSEIDAFGALTQIGSNQTDEGTNIREPRSNQSAGGILSGASHWKPAMIGNLPDDFLRLTVNQESLSPAPSSPVVMGHNATGGVDANHYSDDQVDQYLEDEKLAMFLQNEEFIRELRRNPDFIMSLEEDHREFVTSQGNGRSGSLSTDGVSSPPAVGGARPKISGAQDDVVFRHKLKHMGKSTKKKFGKIAKRFSRKKGGKVPLHGDSTANLLEDDVGDEHKQGYDSLATINEDGSNRAASPGAGIGPREEQSDQRVTGRRLPPIPASNSPSNEEPIVFYSEDNEFAYKSDC